MRRYAFVLLLGGLAIGNVIVPSVQGQRRTEQDRLLRAREAIGIAGAPFRNITLAGRYLTTQAVSYEKDGNRVISLEIAMEIKILRPDRYVRLEKHGPQTGGLETWRGISGDKALSGILTPAGLRPARASTLGRDFAANAYTEAAKMVLGVAALSTDFGLRVQGSTASGTEVTGRHGFRGTVVVDSTTGMPVQVLTNERIAVHKPGTFVRHGPQGPAGGAARYEGPPVQVVTTFDNRRDVDGRRLPFLVRTTAGGVLLNEFRVERVGLDVPLTASEFTRWLAVE